MQEASTPSLAEPAPVDDPDLVGARRSASVIVLRDSPDGIEVLMMQRQPRAGDIRSALWVFPGGMWDARDALLHARCQGWTDAALSRRMGLPADALDDLIGAIRECYEEVGLLFATNAPDVIARAVSERVRGVAETDFVALCERHDLQLDGAALVYHSHWLTPPGMAQRFSTRFFVALAPAGQVAQADEAEAQCLRWYRAAEALSAQAALKMLPVTRRILQDIDEHQGDARSFMAMLAARTPPPRQMPRLAARPDGQPGSDAVLPQHPAWHEIGLLDARGRGDCASVLTTGLLTQLTPRVRRLVCGNSSVMTGPGTNTYLIADPGAASLTVLDPGPNSLPSDRKGSDEDLPGAHDMPAHVQAIIDAAGAQVITQIVVTHTHIDHSPAARLLAERTGARLIGRLPTHPKWQDATFAPDHEPVDGEVLAIGPGCHLRAVATPGHASNHICWWLPEDRLLFTGDQVMQGSTVVINPPDGDMGAYIASLQRLQALDIDWFAPGHGFLIAEPAREAQRLIAHRLQREALVFDALAKAGPSPVSALVDRVYGRIDAVRRPLAERSLLAHLIKLQADGRVTRDGEVESACWRVS